MGSESRADRGRPPSSTRRARRQGRCSNSRSAAESGRERVLSVAGLQRQNVPGAGVTHHLDARSGFLAVGLAVAVVLAVFWSSVSDLVHTWYVSGSYNHCFFVFPFSAWLIWKRRHLLNGRVLKPWLPGLALLGLVTVLWTAGYLAGVKSLRDLAVVSVVPVLLVTILGREFGRVMIFPLAFMFFAWPFGEIFIPTMIDWTADFTVTALRATGVPVLRQGNSFIIPTGEWSVVEECSGIRYLMASMTVGAFFAYITFRSNARRWFFLVLSVVVPLVANWLRAYFIVLLGHISQNRIATGVDHLIYGWIFFGIVMVCLFYVGSRMSDRFDDDEDEHGASRPGDAAPSFARGTIAASVLAIAVAGAGPAWAMVMQESLHTVFDPAHTALPESAGSWLKVKQEEIPDPPRWQGAMSAVAGTFAKDGHAVGFHAALSWRLGDEHEALSYSAVSLPTPDKKWHQIGAHGIVVPGTNVHVIEKELVTGDRRLLAWEWYRVGEFETDRFLRAKLEEGLSRLEGHSPVSGRLTLYAPIVDDSSASRARIRSLFLELRPIYGEWFTAERP
ncbi:MAG: exosortase A [Betaproteobacteria bacterium]|nr:exosortase A [Betaproteobacteria bacterium]